MPHKCFYRASGTERKQISRQRTTTIKLDLKLNELEADSTVCDIIEETGSEKSSAFEDLMAHTKDIDDQLDHENSYHMQPEMMCESNYRYSTSDDIDNYGNDDNNNSNNNDNDDDDDNHDVNDNENNEDDDDILVFINAFHESREKKLHSSSKLSIYDACIEIVKLARDLNLNKKQILRLLYGIRVLLPPDTKVPRTVPCLLKIVREYCFSCNVTSFHVNCALS